MKILTANIAMGLRDMDYLPNNLRGLAAYHGWRAYFAALPTFTRGRWAGPPYWSRRVSYMREHEDLAPTLNLVEATGADVVILNEVLPEIHEPRISNNLKKLGYKSIAIGFGAKYPDARVSTIVAGKENGEQFELMWPQTPHPGCGGGGVGLSLNGMSIIGVHTALGGCDLWRRQVDAIASAARREQQCGQRVIIGGDWNEVEEPIFQQASFAALNLASTDEKKRPTCPTSLPVFLRKSLDHIFVPKSSRVEHVETLAFGSDHLALLVDISI